MLQWTSYDHQSDFEECFEDLFAIPLIVQSDDQKNKKPMNAIQSI
jgi:hypothetical protein